MSPQILRGGPLAILQQPAWFFQRYSTYHSSPKAVRDIPHHWYLVHCPCLKANAKLCPVLVVAAVATSQSRRSVKPLLCISFPPLSWILGSFWSCPCGLSSLSAATADHCHAPKGSLGKQHRHWRSWLAQKDLWGFPKNSQRSFVKTTASLNYWGLDAGEAQIFEQLGIIATSLMNLQWDIDEIVRYQWRCAQGDADADTCAIRSLCSSAINVCSWLTCQFVNATAVLNFPEWNFEVLWLPYLLLCFVVMPCHWCFV